MISTAIGIQELTDVLKNSQIIAFDTEFIRESTFFPIVEIIQIATEDQVWLVDAQAFKKGHKASDPKAYDPGIQPLLDIFSNPNIIKVVHAAQGDQECLFTSFGTLATPIFDTAVGASLCGLGDGIGLGKLMQSVLGIQLAKGHARTNWSVRPLPEQLIEYARADVLDLIRLAQALFERLEAHGRKKWAFEISAKMENPLLYSIEPGELSLKLARGGKLDSKAYCVLEQLVAWRESRVKHLNLPRRWVADDPVLVDLARVRPKDLEHLSAFRGLNKGEVKNSGRAILDAIRVGEERHKEGGAEGVKLHQKIETPTAEENQVLDLLKCFVQILSDQHEVAVKHFFTVPKLLTLLRKKNETPEDLIRNGILSEAAAQLVGWELIHFLQGKRSLSIEGGRVKIVTPEDLAKSRE